MTANHSGRILVTHWAYYLSIAREARDETQKIIASNSAALPGSSLVAIIMSALAAEAFVNELGEAADMARIGREGILSPALDSLQDLANALTEVEDDRGSTALKYQMAYRILSGHTFPKGSSPYQEFRELMNLRNLLVHLKPGDTHSQTGHVVPREKLIREFQQRGLTRIRGRKPGEPLGGMSWLTEIQTAEMAAWAYQAASAIIGAVGEALPTDPPRSGFIDYLKTATQTLPT